MTTTKPKATHEIYLGRDGEFKAACRLCSYTTRTVAGIITVTERIEKHVTAAHGVVPVVA